LFIIIILIENIDSIKGFGSCVKVKDLPYLGIMNAEY